MGHPQYQLASEFYRNHFLVKLDPDPGQAVDIYLDLTTMSNISQLNNAISNLLAGVIDPIYTVFPDEVFLGKTGASMTKHDGTTVQFGTDELYTSAYLNASNSMPIVFKAGATTSDGYAYENFSLEDDRLSKSNQLPQMGSAAWPYTAGSNNYAPLTGIAGLSAPADKRMIILKAAKPALTSTLEFKEASFTGDLYQGYNQAEIDNETLTLKMENISNDNADEIQVLMAGFRASYFDTLADFNALNVRWNGVTIPATDPRLSWAPATSMITVKTLLAHDILEIDFKLKPNQPISPLGYSLVAVPKISTATASEPPIMKEVFVKEAFVYATLSPDITVASAPFKLFVDFDRVSPPSAPIGVKGLIASQFKVKNATITDIQPITGTAPFYSRWEIEITPNAGVMAGDIVSVQLMADKVDDDRGILNKTSNEIVVSFDDSAPIITYGVETVIPYNTPVNSIIAEIKTNGAPGLTAHEIYIDGGAAAAENINLPIIDTFLQVIDSNNTVIPSTYKVVYDKFAGKAVITITPTTPIGEGDYTVGIRIGDRLKNNNGVGLAVSTAPFTVRIPDLIDQTGADGDVATGTTTSRSGKIHAVPAIHEYTGGKSDLVVNGKNLKKEYLTAGQFKFYWTMNGAVTTVANYDEMVFAADGSSITLKGVDIPENPTNAHVKYEFHCDLVKPDNTVITDYATVVVKSADTKWTGGAALDYGLTATPTTVGFVGGTATIKVKGENVHHYADLKIKVTSSVDTSFVQWIPVTPDVAGKSGVFEKTYDFAITENKGSTPITWTYELFDGASSIASLSPSNNPGTADTVQDDATPDIDNSGNGFLIGASHEATATKSITLPAEGGTAFFTVNGLNLHNFKPMTVVNDAAIGLIPGMMDSSFEYTGAHTEMAKTFAAQGLIIPPNKTRDDITYTFLLTLDGVASPHTVTVIVEKPNFSAEGYEADIKFHPASGGPTQFTITGEHLDVIANHGSLELRDQEGKIPATNVTNFLDNGSKALCDIVFPAHISSNLRNDIYYMEIFVDGAATGKVIEIEVGPSAPSVTATHAQPDYFENVETLMAAGSKTKIFIKGNYLENFNSLQIIDVTTGATYDVDKAGKDMETDHMVTVPTARGSFVYQIWADGAYTGLDAFVGVGVSVPTTDTGDLSGGLDDGSGTSTDPRPKEESYKGLGGGATGGGFTGNKSMSFDVLNYQSERAGKLNPLNPVVNLFNVNVITEQHFILAATGAKKGSQSVTNAASAPLEMIVNTSSPANELVVEGQLYITLNKPVSDILTGVYTREEEVKATRDMFASKFDNKNLWVVSLAHNGAYNVKVEIAALVEDIPVKNDSAVLHIYVFDRVTGEYKLIKNTDYSFDSAGYIHFFTEVGGDIVISDKQLTIDGVAANSGTLTPIQKASDLERQFIPNEKDLYDNDALDK